MIIYVIYSMKAILYSTVLFFLLSPGVLFYFPSKNQYIVIGFHAILFAVLLQSIRQIESFTVATQPVTVNETTTIGPEGWFILFMIAVFLLACPACARILCAILFMRA
jgi:hypothetical protein